MTMLALSGPAWPGTQGKLWFWKAWVGLRVVGVVAVLLGAGTIALADVVYQDDMWPPPDGWEIFNNSEGTETEDNWVANSFQVVPEGTRLLSISFRVGQALSNQDVSAVIYLGADLYDPSAGGGLVRIATTDVTVTAAANTVVTIPLDNPVDLNEGDIFYAALLMPSIRGNLFPFTMDYDFTNPGNSPPFLGQSFFDVGPNQGDPYDLDMTQNATVAGGIHPVVGFAMDAGNYVIQVNATTTP
jgi:hypothetical protein